MFESTQSSLATVPPAPGAGAPRERLLSLSTEVPSAAGVAYLAGLDLGAWDAFDRVLALTAWERHRSWFEGCLQHALVAVGGPAPTDSRDDDWARKEVACTLRLSTTTAGMRLGVARELTGRLARTGRALQDGAIGYRHAQSLTDALAGFDDALARRVEAAVLVGGHPQETLSEFRKRLARAVIAADPASADERHETAVGTRRVILWPEPDGMATLAATLTADEAMTAMRALTGLAHLARAAGDDRPIDVLRADVFADTFAAALADPRLPAEQRARPAVGLTIDLATLAHLAEHPGHLDGYGPIPPVLARRIAGGGDWHRLITDPVSGALLDYGRTAYRPPADLVEFVVARDRTCRFPTCARPARLTDIDHAQPWHQGGSTSAANCGALCRSDHRQKTSGNTQLHSHPDGSATWTMASGHTYHQPAIDFCPEHTQHMKTIRAETANKTDRWDTHSEARPPDHCKQPSAEADATHDAPALTATTEDHTGNESGTDPPPF